jgi:hypothetical protein
LLLIALKGFGLCHWPSSDSFHSRTVHFDIIKVLLATDAQKNFFKRSIKIYIKTAPTCFGVITIIRERTINLVVWL